MRVQGHVDNGSLGSCNASYRGEQRFDKHSSCGKFHLRNLFVFSVKWDKFGKTEHIHSIYKTTVYFAASNIKLRSSGLINLDDSNNDILPLFTTWVVHLIFKNDYVRLMMVSTILLLTVRLSGPSVKLESSNN